MQIRKMVTDRRGGLPRPVVVPRLHSEWPYLNFSYLRKHVCDCPVSEGRLDVADRYVDGEIDLETMVRECRRWAATHLPGREDL